jgi:hypothetical protein
VAPLSQRHGMQIWTPESRGEHVRDVRLVSGSSGADAGDIFIHGVVMVRRSYVVIRGNTTWDLVYCVVRIGCRCRLRIWMDIWREFVS